MTKYIWKNRGCSFLLHINFLPFYFSIFWYTVFFPFYFLVLLLLFGHSFGQAHYFSKAVLSCSLILRVLESYKSLDQYIPRLTLSNLTEGEWCSCDLPHMSTLDSSGSCRKNLKATLVYLYYLSHRNNLKLCVFIKRAGKH